MQIVFNVLTIQGKAPFTSMSYTFDQSGGSVGRDQNSDWVLLDDNKFLSGKHFKIHCDGKLFSIVDTSTNGTFLNDSILPLGINISHVLTKGDQVKIGEYIILVSSIMEDSRLDDGYLDERPEILSSLTSDPFFSSEGDFNDSGLPKKVRDTSIHQYKSSFVATDESKTLLKDPFFSTGDESFNPNSDLLNEDINQESMVQPSFSIDINTPIRISNESNEVQEYSDEVDLDDKTNDNEDPDVFNFLDEKEQTQKRDNPSPLTGTKKNYTSNHTGNNKPNKERATPINTPVNTDLTSDNNAAIEALLKGAGISRKSLPADIPMETFEIAGRALKDVLQGAIDLLRSRSEIKNHLHLDRTIINSIENNPLKFMPNAQQIITQLLNNDVGDKTYLPLNLAVEEAFDDIKAHQVAMTIATQTALRTVIKKHFSPKNLAENIAKTNPISAVIPVQRQAKLWSMFETLYEDVEEKATESFQRLLDHEISKAYEEQLLEIKSQRIK